VANGSSASGAHPPCHDEEGRSLSWGDIRAKWVIFAVGFSFFVTGIGHEEGWSASTIMLVLGMVGMASITAVGLDNVD
jgi:hypothetical protein